MIVFAIVILTIYFTRWEQYLEYGATGLPERLRPFYTGLPNWMQRR